MKQLCWNLIRFLESLRPLPLLFFRLILAFGFWMPAMQKLRNFDAVIQWFGSLQIPFPALSAYLSVGVELLGVFLLFLGLLTRLICVPLIFLLCVAIATVHWNYGFAAGHNGFEIPLYYILMLFALLVFGPGSFSLDNWIKKNWLEKV